MPPSKRWEKVYHLIPLLRNTPGICEAALHSGNSMLHTWNASQIHFLTVDMEGCQMWTGPTRGKGSALGMWFNRRFGARGVCGGKGCCVVFVEKPQCWNPSFSKHRVFPHCFLLCLCVLVEMEQWGRYWPCQHCCHCSSSWTCSVTVPWHKHLSSRATWVWREARDKLVEAGK